MLETLLIFGIDGCFPPFVGEDDLGVLGRVDFEVVRPRASSTLSNSACRLLAFAAGMTM